MMSDVISEGDKLLVSHRRLFQGDEVRYFVGRVTGHEGGVIKLVGHTYLRDFTSGLVTKKDEVSTKLYSLSSGTILVYQLPADTQLDRIIFEGTDGHLLVTDGASLELNLSERYQEAHV
jgi:hypothetical protein